uniref:Putative pre-mrna-splicing factor cwc25 n=1 Tax=Culex tarsalis TaxID=7177 RepID=A0A1Q3F1B1_CULTA
MGGGDLNTKKSWHPSTFKNQERVWKAEQADAAEKRKLAELQHEINEERNREELKTIAKKSGLLPDDGDGDRKLEWMYKGPSINREEYLLGRTVDKNFETMDAQEKATASSSGVGISQPKNHVEHECIPFSIRQYKGLEGSEQVDMARKLMEDPLMQIKQKEIESRQKILENPVKLKELHRLLKSDQSIRGRDREKDRKGGKKKDKKDKKKKSKKKRKGSESSDGSDGSDGDDLDKILAEKYKKVQNSMEKQEEVSLDKLLSMKYQKLSKELNKLAKPKKSKKKKDRRRSHSSKDSEPDSDSDREPVRRNRDPSRERTRPGPSRVRERSRSRDRHRRHRSKSPKRREERRRSRSPARISPKPSREPAPRGRRTPVPSSSSESSSPEPTHRRRNDSEDDEEEERRPKPKNFGLVSASGKKLELNKRDEVRLYKREEIKAHQSSQKPSWTKPERKAPPLTEEEMEAKRRAMMSNAEWRDRERKQNVKRYDDEERKLEERDGQKRYDKEFIMKQFKHAANNETVEKRIKSNRNNIQRSGGSMNDNFARR